MTVQEILKIDATVLIQVGATQLQKILSTLKMYKVNLEVAKEALRDKNRVIADLKMKLNEANGKLSATNKENEKLKNTSIAIRSVGEITGY